MEGRRHLEYKIRVRDVLARDGWDEAYSESVRSISTDGLHQYEFLEYRLDFYGSKNGITVGIEIDGDYGHSGKEFRKDKTRTRELWNQYGILVLRLGLWQLKNISDQELLDEINWEINRFVKSKEERRKTQI